MLCVVVMYLVVINIILNRVLPLPQRNLWGCSIMVITPGFEPGNLGSTPGTPNNYN